MPTSYAELHQMRLQRGAQRGVVGKTHHQESNQVDSKTVDSPRVSRASNNRKQRAFHESFTMHSKVNRSLVAWECSPVTSVEPLPGDEALFHASKQKAGCDEHLDPSVDTSRTFPPAFVERPATPAATTTQPSTRPSTPHQDIITNCTPQPCWLLQLPSEVVATCILFLAGTSSFPADSLEDDDGSPTLNVDIQQRNRRLVQKLVSIHSVFADAVAFDDELWSNVTTHRDGVGMAVTCGGWLVPMPERCVLRLIEASLGRRELSGIGIPPPHVSRTETTKNKAESPPESPPTPTYFIPADPFFDYAFCFQLLRLHKTTTVQLESDLHVFFALGLITPPSFIAFRFMDTHRWTEMQTRISACLEHLVIVNHETNRTYTFAGKKNPGIQKLRFKKMLPALRTLDLSSAGPDICTSLLDLDSLSVSFPNLHKLHVKSEQWEGVLKRCSAGDDDDNSGGGPSLKTIKHLESILELVAEEGENGDGEESMPAPCQQKEELGEL